MTLSRNVLAAAAAAALLLPAAASAHTNGLGQILAHDTGIKMALKLNSQVSLDTGASTTLRIERDHDGFEHASTTAHAFVASTTAARLSAKAQRLSSVADFMGSLSSNLSARITSSSLSASSTAAAQSKLGDYNANVANAKADAQAALGIAGQIASTTASTTLAAQAQADLKAARGFIRTAQQDLRTIFRVLFSF